MHDLFPAQSRAQSPAVELKGSVFTLPVLRIYSCDLDAIEAHLGERLAKNPRFFENAAVVIDLGGIQKQEAAFDLHAFIQRLRARQLFPVGIQHGSITQNEIALTVGIAVLNGRPTKEAQPEHEDRTSANVPPQSASAGSSTAPTSQTASRPAERAPAKIIHHPVRSGQRIVAGDGDLIVLAAVNAGAEIIAEGNIHVYAPLRGRALAGVSGDVSARIFCQSLEAELVAIAGSYRVFENDKPTGIRGKSAQIYLDGEQLIVEPLV
jgi:septum site-determining protein MinC